MKNVPPPPEVLPIVDLIGQDVTVQLLELHGGARIYLPANTTGTRLAREIGEAPAAALSAHFGYGEVLIPLAKPWRARVYRSKGMAIADISRILCISRSAVHRAMSGHDLKPAAPRACDPRQNSLF